MLPFAYIAIGGAVILGLVVGSFLNVVILRGKNGETLGGRSRCPHCARTLSIKELIPVASFLFQKGRCRSCGAALSLQYPLVEAGTALAYGIALWHLLPSLDASLGSLALLSAVFVGIAAAIVIFVSDLRWMIIPDGAVLVLAFLGIAATIMRSLSSLPSWSSSLSWFGSLLYDGISACVIALFFAVLWYASRGRWMGFGDAKLALATSLLVGFPASIAAFLFSFWTGAAVGILLLFSKRRTLAETIPFGPFILLGTLIAYFYSSTLLRIAGFPLFL